MRACRAVWTGRCCFGSCVRWGSAAWPASSPGPRSGSASCSGPPPLAFPAGVGTDSSLPSPLCGRRGVLVKMGLISRRVTRCFAYSLFCCRVKQKSLPSTPEVPPGSIDASPLAPSLIARVTGNEVLWWQLRSHVTHWLDGDSVWGHSWWKEQALLPNGILNNTKENLPNDICCNPCRILCFKLFLSSGS